jgi:hypothetical protein
VAIAANTAANVTVTWGKTTPVPITLDALFAPIINNLGLGHGTPGQTLTINGANFARGETTPIVIFPSGIEAVGTREGGTITATIPAGAGSGQLKVKVDGVTSTSLANFQEVMSLELTAEGAEEGGIRDGDGAIASWLGDSFPIGVIGYDTAHVLVNQPALTGWEYTPPGVGTISHDEQNNGTYNAQSLGRSTITAALGSVSGSREVIVAPPAGAILSPAGDTRGVVDLSLTPVGANFLAAWYEPVTKQAQWRMINRGAGDTWTFGDLQSDGASWDGFERSVRVSAAPDENGIVHEICLVYRRTLKATDDPSQDRNGIVMRSLDPLTGAPKTDSYFKLDSTHKDSDRLLDLASTGSSHAFAFLRFDGSKYSHNVVRFSFQRGDDPANGKDDGDVINASLKSYGNTTLLPYSYREDAMSITGISTSSYVVARHIGTSGGSGPTGLDVERIGHDLSAINESTILHETNRVPAVASNGTTTLVAAMELRASGTILKLYRFDANMVKQGLGTEIADLKLSGTDPLNWPINLDWDGTSFILTYGQKANVVVNGQVVDYPQAVVREISADGQTVGPAYPLAKESMMPAFAPSAEGGMALWLDSARRPVMRRVKFR